MATPSGNLNDYRARDFESFRRLLLDRMNLSAPGWQERHTADEGIAIIEALAYVADYLSYYQDAVAAEAYLTTARQRISIARHARALDYPLNNGCNARVWMQIEAAAEAVEVPARVRIYPDVYDMAAIYDQTSTAVLEDFTFETMHAATLYRAHNEIGIYSPPAKAAHLEKGATSAALAGHYPHLAAGDVLVLDETGLAGDGRRFRHAVRLRERPLLSEENGQPVTRISWHAVDALPRANRLAERLPDGRWMRGLSVARGNIVLADHGFTIEQSMPPVPEEGRYEPVLQISNLTHAAIYDHAAALRGAAASAIAQDPRQAEPQIWLMENRDDIDFEGAFSRERWQARRDILRRPRFRKEFAAETGNSGEIRLRFDYSGQGLHPSPAWKLTAIYRAGQGAHGNLGPGALTRFSEPAPDVAAGIARVRNLLAASGGADPEPIEHARFFAPRAYKSERRCVTEGDYERIAAEYPGIRAVRAIRRETGGRRVVYLYLDTLVPLDDDLSFEAELRRFLEPFRLIGDRVEILAADYVPLEIAIEISTEPAWRPETAVRAMMDAIAGPGGFFAPGRPGFGESVYRSQLLDVIRRTPGVADGNITTFRRLSDPENLVAEKIEASPFEILRVENNPAAPGNGIVTVRVNAPSEGLR